MSEVIEVLSKKVYALDQALVLFCLMLLRELIFIKVADLYKNIYSRKSTTCNTGKSLLCLLQLVGTQIKKINIFHNLTYKR